MAVYMIGFALSVGLIAFSEKKRLPVFLTCSFFALLIPCLIAGFRAQHIGTDVLVYVKPLTESAICADNLRDYFNSYWFRDWRNLYVQYYELEDYGICDGYVLQRSCACGYYSYEEDSIDYPAGSIRINRFLLTGRLRCLAVQREQL